MQMVCILFTMSKVVEIQSGDSSIPSNVDNSLHENLSQVTQNFNQKVVVSKMQADNKDDKDILSAKNLSMIVNEIVDLLSNKLNKGFEAKIRNQHILDYLNNQNVTSQEVANW